MEFVLPQGMVLVDMEFQPKSPIPSAERNYDRIGKVLKTWEDPACPIRVGDVICFDEYAYRRFTLDENSEHKQDFTIVDTAHGALWGIIKNYEPRTTQEPMST